MNYPGAGSRRALIRPPMKNKNPILSASRIRQLTASIAARAAPANVPRAWAKKGNIKCLGWNKGSEAFRPSVVVISAPVSGGMTDPLIMISPIFTAAPRIIPASTAKLFLTSEFIFH